MTKDNDTKAERAPIYWMHEAVTYLGLDRLGLAKPEQVIYRMVRKGILKPRKIGRFLALLTPSPFVPPARRAPAGCAAPIPP